MFSNIIWIIWGHSSECLVIFPGMSDGIPRNVRGNSPECSTTSPGMFGNIPRNVQRHSQECLVTFPGMFEDIPRNVWGHYPEYNITPIPRVPRIPFPVPVFLVLNITPHILNFLCKHWISFNNWGHKVKRTLRYWRFKSNCAPDWWRISNIVKDIVRSFSLANILCIISCNVSYTIYSPSGHSAKV